MLTSFTTEIIWSFQERSEPKGTPNIDILSRNSNELESKEMSGKGSYQRALYSKRREENEGEVFQYLKNCFQNAYRRRY